MRTKGHTPASRVAHRAISVASLTERPNQTGVEPTLSKATREKSLGKIGSAEIFSEFCRGGIRPVDQSTPRASSEIPADVETRRLRCQRASAPFYTSARARQDGQPGQVCPGAVQWDGGAQSGSSGAALVRHAGCSGAGATAVDDQHNPSRLVSATPSAEGATGGCRVHDPS